MRITVKHILLGAASALLACALSACAAESASSASEQAEADSATAGEAQGASREEAEAILMKAAEQPFTSVAFTMKTETTATGATSDATMQTQSVKTTTTGELDKSGEQARVHMSYTAESSMQIGKTSYEMFISPENIIVEQGDQLYVDSMTDEMLNSYADSVISPITADGVQSILDMAASYKVAEDAGETTVSITVDKDKLVEANAVDTDSLPENNTVATMVMSYTVGEDDRFKTVRIMSSTSGTPTYRVHQTYQFKDYDTAQLPEWPDLQAYIAEQSGIMTDADGRMYIVDESGQTFYITEIDENGMVYYDAGAVPTEEMIYYYEEPTTEYITTDEPTTETYDEGGVANEGETNAGEEEQGRAYITADDGTIHFLDEEGSQLFDNGDGTAYFIDAEGNFYFLNME